MLPHSGWADPRGRDPASGPPARADPLTEFHTGVDRIPPPPIRWPHRSGVDTLPRRRFLVSGLALGRTRDAVGFATPRKRFDERIRHQSYEEPARSGCICNVRRPTFCSSRPVHSGHRETETKRDGQPADGAIRRDGTPGSSRVPRRRVHMQGRSDRVASSRSILRRMGEGPWRDREPDR